MKLDARHGPRSAVMACPARAAPESNAAAIDGGNVSPVHPRHECAAVDGPHDPQFWRGHGLRWWFCTCGAESGHLYRTATGAQLAYGLHLLAVQRLRDPGPANASQHLHPDIPDGAVRGTVVDVELP